MIGNRHDIPRLQSDMFRNAYYKILRLLFVNAGLVLLLVLSIIYMLLFAENPQYYASTTDGEIIKMAPANASR